MKFTLNIDSDNATFADEGYADAIADLLAQAAQQVREGSTSGYLRDYANGQRVGHWEYEVHSDWDIETENYRNYPTFRVAVDSWNDRGTYDALISLVGEWLTDEPDLTDNALGTKVKDTLRTWAKHARGTGRFIPPGANKEILASLEDTLGDRGWHMVSVADLGVQARETWEDVK